MNQTYKKFRDSKRIKDLENSLKDLKKELENCKKDHQTFIRAYVHEAKNILNSLIGFSDLLMNEKFSDEEKDYFIEIINSSSKKAVKTLEILNITRMTSERLKENSTKINLGKIVREEIDKDTLRYIQERKIAIEITDDTEDIYSCPEAFYFLFSTLGGNSLQWAPDETVIKKYLKTDKKRVIIKLENEYKNSPNLYKHGLNEGIGISLSKKLIETMGGKFIDYKIPSIEPPSEKTEKMGYKNAQNLSSKVYGIKIIIPIKEFSDLEKIIK